MVKKKLGWEVLIAEIKAVLGSYKPGMDKNFAMQHLKLYIKSNGGNNRKSFKTEKNLTTTQGHGIGKREGGKANSSLSECLAEQRAIPHEK